MRFNHTVVAGTFDHLHLGHQKLISAAFVNSNQVSCGLTTKALTSHKPLPSLIQSKFSRHLALTSYLSSFPTPSSIFSLSNSLGNAPTNSNIDSIVTTSQTINNVNKINQLRKTNHLKPLTPIVVDLISATDQKNLSSTRIRKGQINRTGFAFHQIFPKRKKFILPTTKRSVFKKPFDVLLTGSQSHLGWAGLKAKKALEKTKPFMTIAVGDIAVISLLQQQIPLNLSIVDLKTKRKPLFSSLNKLGLPPKANHTVNNPASSITPDLIKAIQKSLKSHTNNLSANTLKPQNSLPNLSCEYRTILVKGEEDLSVLPAILLSPLNSAIFYGQPQKGLVYIRVTENSKQKALNLLKKLS